MKICPLLFSLIFINCLLINSYALDDSKILNETESEEDSEEVYELSDFVVSAEDDKGYFSANSTSITKANELVKNTPINVAIINEQLIEDLGIKTVEDLGKFSASIDTDPTGYSLDQIRIRGFRNTHTRFNGFKRNLPRDSYNTARYDIIKGANSLIYGQASPGGSINAIPIIANFRNDSGSVIVGLGNKDFKRFVYNYNKVINDELALRYMGVDHSQGYEHDYKKYKIDSKTISLNYRPSNNTGIILNAEKVDATFNFPAISMKDKTYFDDSIDTNSTTGSLDMIARDNYALGASRPEFERYDGILSVEESVSGRLYEYYAPFSPDYSLPQGLVDWLIGHTANNHQDGPNQSTNLGGSGIKINSAADIQNQYSLINESNYGYQSGPDKSKRVIGEFATLEVQHSINDSLDFSAAFNYQENIGNNLARDYYGINKVLDSFTYKGYNQWPRPHQHVYDDSDGTYDPEKFIRTYWIKAEGKGERIGSKYTILWDKEFRGIKNKFLLGKDKLTIDKDLTEYDQIPETALNPDGSYMMEQFGPGWMTAAGRSQHIRNNRVTDTERAYEYISLEDGFDPTRSIIRFNEIIETDLPNSDTGFYRSSSGSISTGNQYIFNDDGIRINPDTTSVFTERYLLDENGNELLDQNGNRINDPNYGMPNPNTGTPLNAIWAKSAISKAKITDDSIWFAAQSSFFDGKLRTLLGLRQDKIHVTSSMRKISIYGVEDNYDLGGIDFWETLVDSDPWSSERLNNENDETYEKTSPSLGALYWVNKNFAIFGNYAESIEAPDGQERTPIGKLAPPQYGSGTEAGIRFSTSDNSIDGQLTYYSIEKENDNEFSYSDNMLYEIYPYFNDLNNNAHIDIGESITEYGQYFPELYRVVTNTDVNSENYDKDFAVINSEALPGRRGTGDITSSKGIELDFNYNPTASLTFIGSFNKTLENKVKSLDPRVLEAINEDQKELFGRPNIRASLTGRYTVRSGKYKNLAFGLSQHFRSGSKQAYYRVFNNDGSSNKYYLIFPDEHTTSGFISYKGRFSSFKNSPKYSVTLRINNIFDNRDFIGRGNYGFYKESRSFNISSKISF